MSNTSPFLQVKSFLDFDEEGHNRYMEVRNHIVERFGEPTEMEHDPPFVPNGDKTHYWSFQNSEISLSVWERFAVHYSLDIGFKYR
jgi:hypothetical protein